MTAWDALAVLGLMHAVGWAGVAVAVIIGRAANLRDKQKIKGREQL